MAQKRAQAAARASTGSKTLLGQKQVGGKNVRVKLNGKPFKRRSKPGGKSIPWLANRGQQTVASSVANTS